MVRRKVDIDEEVWEAAKAEAEPFEDDFNSVARRKFGLDPADGQARSNGRRRAAPGSLLPMEEYELPLLHVLDELGGRGNIRDIIEGIGDLVDGRLTDEDRKDLPSGKQVRWRNRVQWEYHRLKKRGLVNPDTPRGIWEITDEGRERLEELRRTERPVSS